MHKKSLLFISLLFIASLSYSVNKDSVGNKIETQNPDIIIGTFLGNFQRNYYGNVAPDSLNIIWKHYLGSGKTIISRKLGERTWAGAGWTGQPLLVKEDSNLVLIQGSYDHNLKKLMPTMAT